MYKLVAGVLRCCEQIILCNYAAETLVNNRVSISLWFFIHIVPGKDTPGEGTHSHPGQGRQHACDTDDCSCKKSLSIMQELLFQLLAQLHRDVPTVLNTNQARGKSLYFCEPVFKYMCRTIILVFESLNQQWPECVRFKCHFVC